MHLANIKDYIEDLEGQDMPVRVELTWDGVLWTASIVYSYGPGDVLLDRQGDRYMSVTNRDPQVVLAELDSMAAVRSGQ